MFPPRCMDSVNSDGCVKSQYQTEEPKKEAEPHTGATFQKSAHAQGDKKRCDKNDRCNRVSLCFRNGVKHQADSIPENNSLETLSRSCRAGPSPAEPKTATVAVSLQSLRRCEEQPCPTRKETKTAHRSNRPQPTEICECKQIQAPAKQHYPGKQEPARA